MVKKKMVNKTLGGIIWPVLIFGFLILVIFVGKNIGDYAYEKELVFTLEDMGINTEDLSKEEMEEIVNNKELEVNNDSYVCENDNSIEKRAYILILGLGVHDKSRYQEEIDLIMRDPKLEGILTYDYNENRTLREISWGFVETTNAFLSHLDVDELVIFGLSAGGIVAADCLNRINLPEYVELHTIAAPLKGYDSKGLKRLLVREKAGFELEIAIGFELFEHPPHNVKVYHHKELTDPSEEHSLLWWCGDYTAFCDILKIQSNNLAGSKEFYYPELNHRSIMHHVMRSVVECHD